MLVADVWIVVPNVAGLACSIAQVFLWCCYYRSAGKQKESEKKESEKKASGVEPDMVIEEGGVSRTPHSLSSIRT